MQNKTSKSMIALLVIVQAVMLAMVFSPFLAEKEEYRIARDKLAQDPSEQDMATWDNLLVQRDTEVCLLSGMLVGLFINSFVLVELINRSLSEGEGYIGSGEISTAPPRGGVRVIFVHPGPMVSFAASLTVTITGLIGIAMTANRLSSPFGFWSLVGTVAGTTTCVLSMVWANMAAKKPCRA